MERLSGELKYAVRSLAGAKKFCAIVIVTLALGIGANTAVFGVLNAVVLRPLPYPEPDRLVRLYQVRGGEDNYLPGLGLAAFREQSRTLDIAAVYTYRSEGADLTLHDRPERVQVLPVSADYFRVLGVNPVAGQVFTRGDERAEARVAVVSARISREYLGGGRDGVGRLLPLDGIPHMVVAILPDSFDDPLQPGVDVWTPVNLQPGDSNDWDNHYLSAIARLRPGVTLVQAQREAATLAAAMQANYGSDGVPRTARVAPLQADTVGSAGRMLWVLLGAVGLLLVIACVNVASLFLARGAARQSELAVRAALGSSRWRLVRQLLVESLLLSLAGGAAGLVLARAVSAALLAAAPGSVAFAAANPLEARVFAFSIAVAMLSGVAFGIAPAWQFTRPNLEGVLRESGRGGAGSRRQTRIRGALVVCQVALALVLLIGAGLLLRTFARLQALDLGLSPADVFTFEVHLPDGRYDDAARRARFHPELHRRLEAIPGVRAAAAVSRLPVTGAFHSWGTRRPDEARPVRREGPQQRVIEGRYFETVGIPLLRGRTFGPDDRADAPRRVVVSQELVRQYYGDEDPVGRRLLVAGANVEVIGVVGDVPITARGTVRAMVYHSHTQFAANRNWALTQVVAADGPAPALADDIRRELAALDPSLVLYQPRMLADVIGGDTAQERFALLLVGAFALVAVALAAIGIYGMLSYSVSRRQRELGIRLALGAQVSTVRALVMREGGRLALAGGALGLAGAAAATRALQSLLFDVSATDPWVYASATVTLLAVALLATWLPARAATRVDPLVALRSDL